MWQDSLWARDALASTADRMLDKLDAGKLTAKLCKDKVGKSFILAASQKSLLDIEPES